MGLLRKIWNEKALKSENQKALRKPGGNSAAGRMDGAALKFFLNHP
jgi:hypothetical protein